ncbi:MAG: hypothetical protein H0W83_01895 [Planctomycetes bacterium]|nr:hypothetical protein [Planctomycetota bacterium]
MFKKCLIISACLLGVACAEAVETAQVTVRDISDGLNIVVESSLGGATIPVRVQLSYIALTETIEMVDEQHPSPSASLLRHYLHAGSTISLYEPSDEFPVDAFGRIRGLVRYDTKAQAGAGEKRLCLQEELIRAGWAIYRKEENDLPESVAANFKKIEAEARSAHRGAWAEKLETEKP